MIPFLFVLLCCQITSTVVVHIWLKSEWKSEWDFFNRVNATKSIISKNNTVFFSQLNLVDSVSPRCYVCECLCVLRFLSIIEIHTSEYTMKFGFFVSTPFFVFCRNVSLLNAIFTFLFHFVCVFFVPLFPLLSLSYSLLPMFSYFYLYFYFGILQFLFLSRALFQSHSVFASISISLPSFDMPNCNVSMVRHSQEIWTEHARFRRVGATEKAIDFEMCLRGVIGCISEWEKKIWRVSYNYSRMEAVAR